MQGSRARPTSGNWRRRDSSYQRALDLYARVPVTRDSPSDLRRRLAQVLWASSRLEFNAYHEDAAEPFSRRMLDVLVAGSDEAADSHAASGRRARTREISARGRAARAEALALMESARQTLIDLRASGYSDKNLAAEIAITEERLARTKVSTATWMEP